MYTCLAILAGILACSTICMILKAMKIVWSRLSAPKLIAIAALARVCTWAAQKNIVRYPRTDPTTSYLTDSGSYVDSETGTVHIEFRRIIVPDSATVYVDRQERGDESATWVNEVTTTFGEMSIPYEFEFDNATNYQWIVYTDWTPGPAVQTNGVWHANWGLDRVSRRYLIPLRTAVRVDGETIATPKSKEDARDE